MNYYSDAAIERIIALEAQLTRTPATGARHRELMTAIRLEADHYRRALDAEQAAEQFDPRP